MHPDEVGVLVTLQIHSTEIPRLGKVRLGQSKTFNNLTRQRRDGVPPQPSRSRLMLIQTIIAVKECWRLNDGRTEEDLNRRKAKRNEKDTAPERRCGQVEPNNLRYHDPKDDGELSEDT